MTPAAVIEEARSWLGTPWQHQAAVRGVGVDCLHLVVEVCRSLALLPAGFALPPYPRAPREGWLEREVAALCFACESAGPGVLLVMRMPWTPQHVALCTGDSVIHAVVGHGVIEQGYRGHLVRRTVSRWHLPGVDHE